MGIRRGPNIVQSGLVLSLDAGNVRSYPGSGTTWRDLSGKNSNGTLNNGTVYSSANKGTFIFDGANDYINLGTSTIFNQFSGDFTVSAWVNRSNTGGTWGNIIGDYYTGGSSAALQWQIGISNQANLFVYNVTNGYVIGPVSTGLTANTWIQVALTRTGSTVTLYANSTVVGTATNTTTFGSPSGNLNIGIDGDNAAEPYTGNISIVQIYNRGLTASEILQNYNMTKSRFGK